MGFPAVPAESGRLDRPGENGLAVGNTGQSHGIKHAERMKRVALVAAAGDGGVEEVQIKMSVVADQNRALAAVFFPRCADGGEDVVQRLAFGTGGRYRSW